MILFYSTPFFEDTPKKEKTGEKPKHEDSVPALDESPQKKKREKPIEKDFVPGPAESPQAKKHEKPVEKDPMPHPAESPSRKKKKKQEKPSEKDSVSATEDMRKDTKAYEVKTPEKKKKQQSSDQDSVSAAEEGSHKRKEDQGKDSDLPAEEDRPKKIKKQEAKFGDKKTKQRDVGEPKPAKSKEPKAVVEAVKKKKASESEEDMSTKEPSSSSRMHEAEVRQTRRNRAEEAVARKHSAGDYALPARASKAEVQAMSSDLKKQESLKEVSKAQRALGSFGAGPCCFCYAACIKSRRN